MAFQGLSRQIGIDVRMAQHTGIGRYIRGTVSALVARPSRFRYTLMGRAESRNDFPSNLTYVGADVSIYGFREQAVLLRLADGLDCFHAPHYNAPIFWKRKMVVTIHDLIHLHFRDHLVSPLAQCYARWMLPKVVKRADAIIAVSEFTKTDVVNTLKADHKKITVIHHGIDRSFLTPDRNGGNVSEAEHRYFLYVGLIKAHKNLGVLLDAFRMLKGRPGIPGFSLKLVGAPDGRQAVVRKWLGVISRCPDIHLMTHVPDLLLKQLYRNAAALVLPSLCEGFGFPLLEAMASRTPIIAARTSSIPEVLGERAGLLFDPYSSSELETCMERILMNLDLRNQLIQDGSERLRSFNWETAARKTEEVYERVLGRS